MNTSMKKTGLIVGKFYPLHQGHLHMILSASLQVDELHIFVCNETARDWQLYLGSQFTRFPTPHNRENWVRELLQHIPGITIHGFNEDGIPSYPNGWEAWSDRLKETLTALNIEPDLIFSSEPQDKAFYETHFQIEVQLVDPPRDTFPVSATNIRERPFENWDFIPTSIRPFFTRTIMMDVDGFANPKILPALQDLFNAVELPNFQKIRLMPISKEDIPNIIQNVQGQQQIISAMIASEAFINQFFEESSLKDFKSVSQDIDTFVLPALLQENALQDQGSEHASEHNSQHDNELFKAISFFIQQIEQRF
ncbi:adenylyltransferase/cytidyltransferase family protein [Ignatzschineria sp. LJL83]